MVCTNEQSVSLFPHEVLAFKHGFCVGTELVLLSKVNLVGLFLLQSLVSVAELGGGHLVLQTVAGVEIHRKHRRQLVLHVLVKVRLLLNTNVFVAVVSS